MSKTSVNFNNYVSLAVMLLMVVALVTGQAGARDFAAAKVMSVAPIVVLDDRLNIGPSGHIGNRASKVGITIITE